jgi:hypothetical protein
MSLKSHSTFTSFYIPKLYQLISTCCRQYWYRESTRYIFRIRMLEWMIIPSDIIDWWRMTFQGLQRFILSRRPKICDIIFWATRQKRSSLIPFYSVDMRLMATPNPKGLLLSYAPQVYVMIIRTGSKVCRILPI